MDKSKKTFQITPTRDPLAINRQGAIKSLVDQGITDPLEIKKILDQHGESDGLGNTEITLEEIKSLMTEKQSALLPDDERFIAKSRSFGLSEEQITLGLTKKKQLVASGKRTDAVYPVDGDMIGDPEGVDTTPFGGRSKQEVLRLAFNSGITKVAALKDIESAYDLVMGTGKKTDEEIKQADFEKAKKFIEDNPAASSEEITVALRQHTSLDATDVNALLGQSGAIKSADIGDLTDSDMRDIAVGLVKDNSGFFSDSKEGKDKTISDVEADETLTRAQKTRILEMIEEEYPKGRSFLQKLLPFGK